MSGNKSLFEETLRGLEAGLRVELIAAFPLETCLVSDDAKTVLEDSRFSDFTCIPLRESLDGPVVGVLERPQTREQETSDPRIHPLDGSMLISAGASLAELIPLLEKSSYRLVVNTKGAEGIVTRSDLQKLPVRLYVFALITHLETVMAKIIKQKTPNDQEWRTHLSDGRLERLEKKRKELQSDNSDLPLLELTDFCDKRDILMELLRSHQGFSRRRFEKDLKAIEDLRNSIAHSGSYADDAQRGQDFIDRHNKINDWIATLSPYLEVHLPVGEPARMLQPAPITTKE